MSSSSRAAIANVTTLMRSIALRCKQLRAQVGLVASAAASRGGKVLLSGHGEEKRGGRWGAGVR